jgi:hypothetical protein
MGFVYAFDIAFIFYFGNTLWNLSAVSVSLGGCDIEIDLMQKANILNSYDFNY